MHPDWVCHFLQGFVRSFCCYLNRICGKIVWISCERCVNFLARDCVAVINFMLSLDINCPVDPMLSLHKHMIHWNFVFVHRHHVVSTVDVDTIYHPSDNNIFILLSLRQHSSDLSSVQTWDVTCYIDSIKLINLLQLSFNINYAYY